jgi:RNA recognition motif-containing protein
MGDRVYVGNLSYNTTELTLRSVFSEDGRTVKRIDVIIDRETGRSKGFAFVTLGSDAEAQSAILALDGREIDGRSMRVSEAKERDKSGPRPNFQNNRQSFGQSQFSPPPTSSESEPRKFKKKNKRRRNHDDGYGSDW